MQPHTRYCTFGLLRKFEKKKKKGGGGRKYELCGNNCFWVLLGYISTENSYHGTLFCVHVKQEIGRIPVAVISDFDDRSGICAGK